MGLSKKRKTQPAELTIAERVDEYAKYHEQKAFAERQLEAHKKWFKADAGDEDTTYVGSNGTEIHVTHGESTRYDNAKLDAHFGDDAANFKTTTDQMRVTLVKPKAS